MTEEFNVNGITAVHIDGDTPKQERDDIIAKFRNGEITILCNVDLISEGFDVPDCECAILLRPTKSLTLYIQQSIQHRQSDLWRMRELNPRKQEHRFVPL